MQAIKGRGYPITKKEAQGLYFKHMNLALDARKEKDRRLFDGHYQRAEYYLHLMNKLGPCWTTALDQGQRVLGSFSGNSLPPTVEKIS